MSKTVLVVEDDRDYQLQLRSQLEAMGFTVMLAEGAEQAQRMFAAGKPDLAIVDLMLEHMDSGFVLCYHMKRAAADMPIIMVTGVATEVDMDFDARTDEERGWIKADVLLDKPVRAETLQREISKLMPRA